MASITVILNEFHLKLNEETRLLMEFNTKMLNFFNFFERGDKHLSIELDVFAENLDVFDKKIGNFIKERLIIMQSIKKVAKKPSASLRDVDSLTQRIENLTKRGQILNLEAEIFFNESETIKEKYLNSKK